MTRRVVIIQETLPQYRVELLQLVREFAAERGIQLELVHGHARGRRGERLSTGALAGAVTIRNLYLAAPGSNGSVVWQPCLRRSLGADLVVVEQANRMLINYLLLLTQRVGGPKVAFWGHGRNLQSSATTLAERFKRHVALLPTWWFAYTAGVAQHLLSLGYREDQITVVGNTIDVLRLRDQVDERRATGAAPHAFRCVYLGGLYDYKRLDLLFAASDMIARDLPGFDLVIAGDGEGRTDVERFAADRSWVTYKGAVTGEARAEVLASARLLLIPGLVGLVLLDSFASGVPLVTTADALHSPEFEYLDDGVNGVIVPLGGGAEAYASTVTQILLDGRRWSLLSDGAERTADRHTVQAAAQRFTDGLAAAIGGSAAAPV